MKRITVTLTVDLSNEEQASALTNLLDYIKENVNDEPASAPIASAPATGKTKTSPPAAKKTTITIAELRELTASKSTEFRAEIKQFLKDAGVSNVSALPEDKFEQYKSFLETLESL